MKRLLKIVLPLAVLLLGFAAKHWLAATGPETQSQGPRTWIPLVETLVAHGESTTLDLHGFGEVRPRSTTALVAQVAAQVSEVSEKLYRGSFFHRGEALLRLEDTDFRNLAAVSQAQWEQAEAALTLEEAEAQVAWKEWQRLGEGEAPAVVLRAPQIQAAQAAVAAAAANLAIARANLARTVITAPFDGRTQERQVDVGSWVTPGVSLAKIYATDAAEVRIPLSLDRIHLLDLSPEGPEHPIAVNLSAKLGDRMGHWQGSLLRTEAAVNPATRMVEAIVQVENPFRAHDGIPALAPGMFLQATLEGRPVKGVFRVPTYAIFEGSRVRVVNSNNRAQEIQVEVVATTKTDSLISSGLHEGDRVILTPLPLFLEGMEVSVLPTSTQTGRAEAQQ